MWECVCVSIIYVCSVHKCFWLFFFLNCLLVCQYWICFRIKLYHCLWNSERMSGSVIGRAIKTFGVFSLNIKILLSKQGIAGLRPTRFWWQNSETLFSEMMKYFILFLEKCNFIFWCDETLWFRDQYTPFFCHFTQLTSELMNWTHK